MSVQVLESSSIFYGLSTLSWVLGPLSVFFLATLKYISSEPYRKLKYALITNDIQKRITNLFNYLHGTPTGKILAFSKSNIIATKFNYDIKVFAFNIAWIIVIQYFVLILFYVYQALLPPLEPILWLGTYLVVSSITFTYHWLIFAKKNIINTHPKRRVFLFSFVLLLVLMIVYYIVVHSPTETLFYIPSIVFITGFTILYFKTLYLVRAKHLKRLKAIHKILYKLYCISING